MHTLIRQQLSGEGRKTVLARFRHVECGMVMAFRPDVSGPVWVAKRVTSDRGRLRLRKERRALEYLEPWRQVLRTPRILAWSEDEAGACLILAGFSGCSRFPWLWRRGMVDGKLAIVQQWLRQFQQLVPSPEPVDLPKLQQCWLQALRELPQRERRSVGLWAKFEQTIAPARPAVAVHNDFWWGNLLFEGGRMGVVDWDGFQAGTPLDDLLTLLFKTPVGRGWNMLNPREAFCATFFEASPARRLVQNWAAECGLSAAEVDFCFYSFLVRRLHWELGMSLQPRPEPERTAALLQWSAILSWLAERRYPSPMAVG